MRTITQRTTLPFLIAESGAASFTAAVTTSPNPARSPRSPPRGKMQESLRAPLLSATSRIVRIPIINIQSPVQRGGAEYAKETRRKLLIFSAYSPFSPLLRVESASSHFDVDLRRLHAHLGGATDYFSQLPPLQFAQRTAFHDAHDVAQLGVLGFVMGIKLFLLGDDS